MALQQTSYYCHFELNTLSKLLPKGIHFMTCGSYFPNICTCTGSFHPTQNIASKTLHISYRKIQPDPINELEYVELDAC